MPITRRGLIGSLLCLPVVPVKALTGEGLPVASDTPLFQIMRMPVAGDYLEFLLYRKERPDLVFRRTLRITGHDMAESAADEVSLRLLEEARRFKMDVLHSRNPDPAYWRQPLQASDLPPFMRERLDEV